MVMSH